MFEYNKMTKQKANFPNNTCGKVVIFLIGCLLIGCGVYLSFKDKTASATATYSVGILCFIFSFLSSFSEFEGFGIKAKLLDEKIKEADLLLEKLQEATLPIAELLFTQVARAGRWGAPIPRREIFRLEKNIEVGLLNTGVKKDKIDSLKGDWHRFNLFDQASPLVKHVTNILDHKLETKDSEIQSIPRPVSSDNQEKIRILVEDKRIIQQDRENISNIIQNQNLNDVADELKRFVENCPSLGAAEKDSIFSDTQELFEDIIYYSKHHEFRRLEHWFSSERKK